jgi:hypothetical protein
MESLKIFKKNALILAVLLTLQTGLFLPSPRLFSHGIGKNLIKGLDMEPPAHGPWIGSHLASCWKNSP